MPLKPGGTYSTQGHGKIIENYFPSPWHSICTTWRLEYKLDMTPPPGLAHRKYNNKDYPSISMKSMEKSNVTAIIWQEDDVYVSKCPELEVASAGDTPEEALENLKEAVELYLENAKALGIFDDFAASLHSQNKFTSTFGVTV